MKIKRLRLNNFYSKHFYLALFSLTVVVGVLSVLPFMVTGKIYAGDDLPFHINRIKDMLITFQNHRLVPSVSFTTFSKFGLGINLFYPWLTSAFFALIRLVIANPVIAIYSGLALISMFTFVSAYWSMQRFSYDRVLSIIFSLLYTFSIYRIINMVTRFDIGELGAMVFLPIAMYTFYECTFLSGKTCVLLGMSFGLILNMHILSGIILAMFFLTVYVISVLAHHFNFSLFLKLIISVLIALVVSTMTWLPVVSTTMGQKLYLSKGNLTTAAPTLGNLVLSSLNNSLDHNTSSTPFSVGILLIIGSIGTLFFFKSMVPKWKIILISSIALLGLSTTLFPWGGLQNTPVNIIRFPFQILQIDTLLLAAITAYGITRLNVRIKSVAEWSVGVIGLLFVAASLGFISTQSTMKDFSDVKYFPDTLSLTSYTLNSKSVDKLDTKWVTTDYLPNKSVKYIQSLYKHEAIIGNKKTAVALVTDRQSNGIKTTVHTVKREEHIDLPVLMYDKVHYKAYDNNKLVKLNRTNRNTIGVVVSQKGRHVIKVVYNNILLKLGFIISLTAVLAGVLGQLVLWKINNKKDDVI